MFPLSRCDSCGQLLRILLVGLAVPLMLRAHSTNMPAGYTGGFGEPNCTQCHSGTPNPSSGSVTLLRPGYYPAGGTATITVTIHESSTDRPVWALQLSARYRNGKQAGSFGVTASPSGVQYFSRTASQDGVKSYTFTAPWTAPLDASGGDVVFSVAAMAADGRNDSAGDHVFLAEAASLAPAQPRVSPGGVVNAANYGSAAAPGSIISIFGENFAPWEASAGATPLPLILAETRVLINGMQAPLFYVSRAQINAQVPFEVSPDVPATVAVHGANRSPSAAEPLHAGPVAPAIFTFSGKGVGPGAILHSDSITPVSDLAPARPGEAVVIFCNGLGLTRPQLGTGEAAPAGEGAVLYRTVEMPLVTIGGQNARVDFSGAAPGLAGVYQINAVIPGAPAGDLEVIVTIGGKQSTAGVTVRVQP